MSTPATRELNLDLCSVASPELGTPGLSVPAGPILMEDQDVRGRSMEWPRVSRIAVGSAVSHGVSIVSSRLFPSILT